MTPPSATHPVSPGTRVSRSALWLFLPVAAVLLLALRERVLPRVDSRSLTPPEAPEAMGASVSVDGWVAEHVRASDGARLRARLEPLHPDPRRQSFDAAVLAERLGLDPLGAPWRLSLAATDPELASVEAAPLVPSIAGVRVDGLTPLPAVAPEGRTDLAPLATLLGAPDGPLGAGESCDLVLWGPAPDAPSILVPGLGALEASPSAREAPRRSEALAWKDARTPSPEAPR